MPASRFRKKPVEIDAVRWDGTAEGATPIIDWILGGDGTASYVCSDVDRCAQNDGDAPHSIEVYTLEGHMRADVGDWIVRGVAGEFYPVKPSIFDATYEPVDGGDIDQGEVPELRDLPPEVRRLVHRVDAMRDGWAEGDDGRRRELWRAVHEANDGVWSRLDGTSA